VNGLHLTRRPISPLSFVTVVPPYVDLEG